MLLIREQRKELFLGVEWNILSGKRACYFGACKLPTMNACCQICLIALPRVAAMNSQNDLDLNRGAWRAEADMLIDLLRSRLTFSKFVLPLESDKLGYTLAFSPIQLGDCRQIHIEDAASGITVSWA